MDLVVSMTRFVVHDYLKDLIHTQSHQRSLLHLWGNLAKLSLRLMYFVFLFSFFKTTYINISLLFSSE